MKCQNGLFVEYTVASSRHTTGIRRYCTFSGDGYMKFRKMTFQWPRFREMFVRKLQELYMPTTGGLAPAEKYDPSTYN